MGLSYGEQESEQSWHAARDYNLGFPNAVTT